MTLHERFNIPENHQIKQVRSKTKGTMGQNEYWTYHELDEEGTKISVIEEWSCTNLRTLNTDSGFEKYDTEGNLIEKGS